MMQLRGVDAPLNVSPRIGAGRGVSLKIDEVSQAVSIAAAEEMVETHFIERRRRRVGGNMAPYVRVKAVGFDNHGHCIPAHVTLDAALDFTVTRIGRLFIGRNGIDVGSIDAVRNLESGL